MRPDHSNHLPLSPAAMHVLLAVMNGDLHGYGILLEVTRQSQGEYKIGPGTLYDNLKKLLSQGSVEEPRAKGSQLPVRREYHITDIGCDVLRAETQRLSQVIRDARRSLRLNERAQS